jgi:TRAP-type C4-dicarboxylate transport system permease small subunit
MKYIRLAFDWLFAALTWFALTLLIAMTVILFSDVFCRYILHFSIAWADEIVLVLLIWFVFIALAIGVRKKIHMSIDFLTFFLPKKFLSTVAERLVDLLTFGFGCVLIYFGIVLIKIGSYSTLASINLPSYLEYIFVPVSGVLVLYSALFDFLRNRSVEPQEDFLDKVFMGKAERHV